MLLSAEGEADFVRVGQLHGGTVIGSALTVLPAGPIWGWDRFSHVDIEVLADCDWLKPRSEAAVLSGANLAMLRDELVQFAHVEALVPQRFRLSRLLRGRRGTESAVPRHNIGDLLILIDSARTLPVELPLDRLGRGGRRSRQVLAMPRRSRCRLCFRALRCARARRCICACDARAGISRCPGSGADAPALAGWISSMPHLARSVRLIASRCGLTDS